METYTISLVVLTLLATLHLGTSDVSEMSLTDGDIFKFRCNIIADSAVALFDSPLRYHYTPAKGGKSSKLSDNSASLGGGWNVEILKNSDNTNFTFELAKTVNLDDSGTYVCSRVTEENTFEKTVILTVTERTEDVGLITFSITAFDGDTKPTGAEMVLQRTAGDPDPAPEEVHLDSGYYQAHCEAADGVPKPTYLLKSGDTNLEFGQTKTVLLNSGTPDLSCHVENGNFRHHLQFNLTINPGHPDIVCDETETSVGAKDAEIDCVVTGKDLDCSYFSWISETDMSLFNQKANFSVECKVNENRTQMKNILRFNMIEKSDFDDRFILKFENLLGETFQKVNKLMQQTVETNAGNNAVPMGTATLLFLSMLGLLL